MQISLKDAIELVHQMTGVYRPVAARCIAGALARGALHAQYTELIETLVPEIWRAKGVENGPAHYDRPDLMHHDFWQPAHCNITLITAPVIVSSQSLTVATLPSRWDIETANSKLDARCWLISEAFGVTVSPDEIEGVFGDPGYREKYERWPGESRTKGQPNLRTTWRLTDALVVGLARGEVGFDELTNIQIAMRCASLAGMNLSVDEVDQFLRVLGRIRPQIWPDIEEAPTADDQAN